MNSLPTPSTATSPINRRPLPPAAFSVSARVAMQLGRENIASTNTAILELVKNAYDADAEEVRIRFSHLGTPQATLVIEDNGNGMAEEEIRDYWLCIGTTNKQESSLSRKKNRIQTGEKGLGRLGLDRLSRRTRLQTKRRTFEDDPKQLTFLNTTGPRSLELDIDWERYNAKGQRLETIAHEVYELDNLDHDALTGEQVSFEHGTRLILEGLKDDWIKNRIEELRNDLALTLSPFSDQSDFKVTIESGFADIDGAVHPNKALLHLATWRIEAAIIPSENDSGSEDVVIKMSSREHSDKYVLGPLPWEEFTKHNQILKRKISHCGPIEMTMYVFIRDAEELGVELSGVANFLKANMGIRIYRDGFRVKPYGDPRGTNDWLSLSMRRAQNPAAISRKSWKVAYHQVVGAVLVSRHTNISLVDQTNREGLVEGLALNDLRTFAGKVISYFEGKAHEDYVAQHPPKSKQDKAAHNVQVNLTTVENQLEALAKRTAEQARDPSNLGAAFQNFAEETARVLDSFRTAKADSQAEYEAKTEVIDELKDELRLTTSLASLGIMAASFGHERVKDAVTIRNEVGLLKNLMENPTSSIFSKEDQLNAIRFLEEGALRIEAFAQFSLDHVRPGKRRGTQSVLAAVISTTFRMFKTTTDTMQIKTEIVLTDNPVIVPGWEAGWESLVANLIINSCHFLRPRKAKNRLIKCTLLLADSAHATMIFEDSGIGLEVGTELDIFRPGFSTRRGSDGLQEGTGLGLALVRSFVDSIGGKITASNSSALGGASFLITAPIIPVSRDNV